MEFDLRLHEHPMSLCEKQESDDGEEFPCLRCLQPVSGPGPAYSCSECNVFIHDSCARLPRKIIHFLHPRHPLMILENKETYGSHVCNNCNQRIWASSYGCSICEFSLDINCVFLQEKILEWGAHGLDEHSYILHRPTLFTCDICGEDDNGMSYLCTTCQLKVHKECASLPTITINSKGNCSSTRSMLVYSVPDEKMDCNLCGQLVDKRYWAYCCENYCCALHLNCAEPNKCREDMILKYNEETGLAFFSCRPVNKGVIGLPKPHLEEKKRVTELHHFSHQHCLTLSHNEPENEDIICDACVLSISAPFYKCTGNDDCNFFLHASCADLRSTMRHPLHPHPLTLLDKANKTVGVFRCNGCSIQGNGFAYTCQTCNFFLDVRCTSLTNPLIHDGHKHELNLVTTESTSSCNACGLDCQIKFRCAEECDFSLDLQCASLPYKVKHLCPGHDWGTHFFQLTYNSVEDANGQYYCLVCEEPRAKNHWFYDCEDCTYPGHPECVLGKKMIKFGKKYNLPYHLHPLTLVKTKKDHPLCDSCGRPCIGLVFVCMACNFNLDLQCASYMHTCPKYEYHMRPLPFVLRPNEHDYYCFQCNEWMAQRMFYCKDCDYGIHPKCMPESHQKIKFGKTYKFHDHPHPFTAIGDKNTNRLPCLICGTSCDVEDSSVLGCVECNVNVHWECY